MVLLSRHHKGCPVCRYVLLHLIFLSFPCLMHLATPVSLSMSTHYSTSRYRQTIRIRLCHPQTRRSFKATSSRNRAERSTITPPVIVCLLKSTRWNCVVAMGQRSIRWCATSCTYESQTRGQKASCSRPGRTRFTVRNIPFDTYLNYR